MLEEAGVAYVPVKRSFVGDGTLAARLATSRLD